MYIILVNIIASGMLNDNRDNDNHDNDCHAIKILYIFRVERKMENGAQGSGNLFLGLQKFAPCPERKN